MKKIITIAAAIFSTFVSCENAEIRYDDVTGPGRLFLNEATGLEKIESFVIPDEGTTYSITPRLSKPMDKDVTLTLFVDKAVLDAYNKQNKTSYLLLPETNYEFEATTVIPAGKVVSKPITVALKALTNEQNKTSFVHALPLAVRADNEEVQALSNASSFILAATPVPYSNVVELTGAHYLQLRFAEDYKLSSWTFETLFNPSEIYDSNQTSWLASAIGYYVQAGTKAIQDGFMLRLGDMGGGTHNSLINGMVSRSGKQVSSIPLRSNIWHHVAVVCDEGDITLYINGNVGYTAKSAYAATQFYALNGIRMGAENGGVAGGGPGTRYYRYCQVRFWGVARSLEELNNNRYAVPADTPGLLGYWKLDEYTEGTASTSVNLNDNYIEEDTPMKEVETYLFKDATGKQPDAFICPGYYYAPYILTENKRIEIGYTWDGVPAQ